MRAHFILIVVAALLPSARASAQAPETAVAVVAPKNPPVPLNEERADRGRDVYQRFCLSCHGEAGDGRGYSAPWMNPAPRDFTRGVFKCVSTPSGTLPVDDDLMRTLRNGFAHTNMPSWNVLGDRNLRDVAEYLKTLSPRWKQEGPGTPIAIPPEPPDDAASRAKGKEVWNTQGCFNCHGQAGKGDGPSVPTLMDDWGNHIVPFDFTKSAHRKCGDTDRDLYRTIMTGVNGTPMPSCADTLKPDEAWQLVHYLKTLREEKTSQHLFGLSMGK